MVQTDARRPPGCCRGSGPPELHPEIFLPSVSPSNIWSYMTSPLLSSCPQRASPIYICGRKAVVWIWVRAAEDQGGQEEPESPDWTVGNEGQGLCEQTALGTPGQRRRSRCDGQHLFLCERHVIGRSDTTVHTSAKAESTPE